jgi:hypothetical protein
VICSEIKKRCWYASGQDKEVKNRRFNIPLVNSFGMDDVALSVKKMPGKIVMGVLAQDFKRRWP